MLTLLPELLPIPPGRLLMLAVLPELLPTPPGRLLILAVLPELLPAPPGNLLLLPGLFHKPGWFGFSPVPEPGLMPGRSPIPRLAPPLPPD